MNEILVAFITGLTTGGLSCLAVQGGLLASSLAGQIEQDLLNQPQQGRGRLHKPAFRLNAALPIAAFLLAKLAAYTLLGALLGWLGSFLTFDPYTRAALLVAVGVFMVGNALRMLDVHPIFRYFSLQPPRAVARFIRRTAKEGGQRPANLAAPLFLGALTVFIPCGVTQAMMAAALGAGSPLQAAALMFAFTLGTSPVFFLVAYLAARLGARLEKNLMRLTAAVILFLGLVSVDSGLNLTGAPFSFTNLARQAFPNPGSPAEVSSTPAAELVEGQAASAPGAPSASLALNVENNGYFPSTLRAPAGQPVRLALVTQDTYSCSRDFVIPALKVYKLLPASGQEIVDIPPQPAGSVLRFTCSMGMYTGRIVFEN